LQLLSATSHARTNEPLHLPGRELQLTTDLAQSDLTTGTAVLDLGYTDI
jgi:hypothetical protein